MSYSSQTKEELCRLEPDSVCCLLAELSGIVSAAGSVIYRGGGEKRLSIETENNAVARRTFRLLRDVFDVQPELVTLRRSRLGGRNAYRVEISGSEASFVLEGCGIEVGQRRGVPREITVRKCCRMSFLRGVFLACGSVTDPEKEYHLEFVLEDESFAAALQRLIARFSLNAHVAKRRSMTLVYLKGQSEITDMLSIFGAQSARFAMEDAYIRKELRNNANRAVNCDSANVQRAVTAASRPSGLGGRNALRLTLTDIGTFIFSDKGEYLQHNIAQKRAHQILPLSGIQQRHVQYHNVNAFFFGQYSPLL